MQRFNLVFKSSGVSTTSNSMLEKFLFIYVQRLDVHGLI